MVRPFIITLFAIVACARSTAAQSANVDVLGGLALRCLKDVPGDVKTFQLTPSPRMPFLQTSLSRYWLDSGYIVYLGDSVGVNGMHELRYEPEAANVTYAHTERDSLIRTIDLSLSHTFVSPQGLLLDGDRCSESASDRVLMADVSRLEQGPWEEARGVIPPRRGWRTWGEPLVVGTSIAAVVYLFFSVRS